MFHGAEGFICSSRGLNYFHHKLSMLSYRFFIYLATEPHSQRWNKILITECDFAVNTFTAINKVFISHDLVN